MRARSLRAWTAAWVKGLDGDSQSDSPSHPQPHCGTSLHRLPLSLCTSWTASSNRCSEERLLQLLCSAGPCVLLAPLYPFTPPATVWCLTSCTP